MGKLSDKVKVVEEPLKIAGPENKADIGTRGRATLEDIGPASLWQRGPDFLCRERDAWELEVPEEVSGAVPDSEVRQRAVINAVQEGVGRRLEGIVEQIVSRTENLHWATAVLARVLAGLGAQASGDQPLAQAEVRRTPTPKERPPL